MPGRSCHEAVEKYLEPIFNAVRILVSNAQLIGGPNFYNRQVGQSGYWRLGGEDGLRLRSNDGRDRTFYAEQAYTIIESEPDRREAGKFRVTTDEYAYNLTVDGIFVWKMHWHPEGRSEEWRAHYHLTCGEIAGNHLPSGRHTIEDAVEWCIRFGAQPEVSEERWADVLTMSKKKHELHRGWSGTPERLKNP
ncbi:hypothetical protein [Mycobacteroides sp. PCS013]|uniref:hypothetical protein n=1 Tax=Mycobacteroides sp. PCS013 TaxID=3074106 RepID=UPI003C2B611E